MDEEEEKGLVNISVAKRKAVRPRKRPKIAVCATRGRKTTLDGHRTEPPGLEHGENDTLWEAILGERVRGGKTQSKVRWLGFGAEDDSWVPADRFTIANNPLINNWRERNKRRAKKKQLRANATDRPAPKYKRIEKQRRET
jgi:hypothetical protein